MTRIFGTYAYGDGPRASCWWDDTVAVSARPVFGNTARTDVAIIGAGFTGLSAALHLARSGVSVTVLDAQRVGWGASGRNGGFCCLGGGMLEDAALDQRFGTAGRIDFRRAEREAIALVERIITEHGIDVDHHSRGETSLAHRPSDMDDLIVAARSVRENYDVDHALHDRRDLIARGMGGTFHGGLTIDAGFALNPRKYIDGLVGAAEAAGARVYEQSAVTALKRGW